VIHRWLASVLNFANGNVQCLDDKHDMFFFVCLAKINMTWSKE
jgi:hypothetical protein